MNRPPNREIEIFTEARSLPVEDRAAFLGRACGDDAELRQRVAALLQVHEQAGDFMESPAVDALVATDLAEALSQKPGDRIGRYKLLDKIGEGGCGVVYMAEQEEPVRRQVALKIVKPGMDTKSVIARFEAERQALALMDHPSIAKILDAGATASGRPYFVMELVRGTKITDYCNQHALSPRARLELFVQVCHAIEHAHQKGIIHRDIKPSNILVTENVGGVPVPVVIDFGIAKATMDQRLTDKTLFTAFEMLIGTPAYMSPEQAALTSGDVDTRTDIYGLGVLLYELLTGAPPFDTGELLKSGLDEVRRVIREREPPRPSTRLSTLSGEALTSIAQQRKLEAPALIRIVRGDLDWIAMRALEKDRTRRYETANGLALDVQHYLADEVISARPPSRLYRLRKMVARNPVVFAGSLTVVVLLVVSLVVVSTLLANERQALREMELARRQAETDKAKALTESNKSQQVTRFLEDMLRGAQPTIALGRDTTMLREILDSSAQRIRTDLADQPANRAHLQILMGGIYNQLTAYTQAEACFKQAIEICRDRSLDDGRQLATALCEISTALGKLEKVKEAVSAASESLALRQKLFGEESVEAATSLYRLAYAYQVAGKFDEAETSIRTALALRRHLIGSESAGTADALNTLAGVLRMNRKFPASLPPAQEAGCSPLGMPQVRKITALRAKQDALDATRAAPVENPAHLKISIVRRELSEITKRPLATGRTPEDLEKWLLIQGNETMRLRSIIEAMRTPSVPVQLSQILWPGGRPS